MAQILRFPDHKTLKYWNIGTYLEIKSKQKVLNVNFNGLCNAK